MSGVQVAPEVIDWACKRAGLAVPELAKVKGFEELPKWRDGTQRPTRRDLERFAAKTRVPLGYLYLRQPPAERLPIPLLRTDPREAGSGPSLEFRETVDIAVRRQDWMEDYRIEEGWDPLPFVQSVGAHADPTDVARDIRRALGLDTGWATTATSWEEALQRLIAAAEEAGVLVMRSGVVGLNHHRKLDPGEFRGFVLVNRFAPLVFINGRDWKAAQIFTLAHGLAHVLVGHSAAFDLRRLIPADDPLERICDAIAAEFLVPAAELEEYVRKLGPGLPRDDLIESVARRFKVSGIVAARRLADLHVLSRDQFFDFYGRRRKELPERSGSGGGNFYATNRARLGDRFAMAIAASTLSGRTLITEACSLTGMRPETFMKFAKKVLGH